MTVSYTVPSGPNFIRSLGGGKAGSFSGETVTNNTEPVALEANAGLTASVHEAPSSHDGSDRLHLRAALHRDAQGRPQLHDDARARPHRDGRQGDRGEPKGPWKQPQVDHHGAALQQRRRDSHAARTTTDCDDDGAICTSEGVMLSEQVELTVPGPDSQERSTNNPPTGAPTISGTARVGETLTASTTGISDTDGLTGVTYVYQWIRSEDGTDTEIAGANGLTYELADDDEGKTIKVRVSFTDDGGNKPRH